MSRLSPSKTETERDRAVSGLSALTKMLIESGFKPHQIEAVFRKPATAANSIEPRDGASTVRSATGTKPSRAA